MSDKVATFQLTVKQTEDEKEVYLHASARMVPANLAPEINRDFIVNLLANNDFGNYQLKEDDLDAVVVALNDQLEEILVEQQANEVKFDTHTIAYAVDAEAHVEVPDDKLTARLVIKPAKGGRSITVEQAKKLLEEAGVTYGIDEEKITTLIAGSYTATTDTVSGDVAFALAPVDGDDAYFEPLVATANERILKPRLREDGTVDMLDLGDMPTVKVGSHLMRKHPPTDGEKGINVNWEFIAPKKGIDKQLKPGTGTELSNDDPNLLVAAINGQPNLLNNTMKVDDAVQVTAVDISTGNMVLDANLLVKGDIAEGLKVRCEGDVTVGGVIESADVIAKGNIIVGKGIIGKPHFDSKDRKYSCRVEAGGDICAMFASYAKLRTSSDIHIAEQLLHCDTDAKGVVTVGNEKTVGSQIVGGITRSNEGVKTDILGASAGVPTQLDLTGRLKLKQMELSCIHSIIAGKEKMYQTMMDAMSKFAALPSTPARQQHMVKIKNTIDYLKAEVDKAEELGTQVKAEMNELSGGVRIKAKRKIHPNVMLKIGHNTFKNSREREAGDLLFEDGEIKYRTMQAKD
jgi:uncharacterized protein (DUF342 family)